MSIYNRYSDYLKDRYKERVYKLPVSIPVSCPNRLNGKKGCSYCGGEGAGFENLSGTFSVHEQLSKNKEYIGKRYKAKKFIAYFQSFTNTFLPVCDFEKYINEASEVSDIVEIAVSTRPDCIHEKYLDVLKKIKEEKNINITVELGLQTVNYHSLKKVNRGHTLAEYIDAVLRIKKYGFQICTHIILNLPWDNIDDSVECAKIVSVLGSDYIKLHALYIEKDTDMADEYMRGDFEICSVSEYKDRVIDFLRHLSPDIAVQRIIGRAPEENTLFSNWSMSWWKIHDEIEKEMTEKGYIQGDLYMYTDGSAVRNFV